MRKFYTRYYNDLPGEWVPETEEIEEDEDLDGEDEDEEGGDPFDSDDDISWMFGY